MLNEQELALNLFCLELGAAGVQEDYLSEKSPPRQPWDKGPDPLPPKYRCCGHGGPKRGFGSSENDSNDPRLSQYELPQWHKL